MFSLDHIDQAKCHINVKCHIDMKEGTDSRAVSDSPRRVAVDSSYSRLVEALNNRYCSNAVVGTGTAR